MLELLKRLESSEEYHKFKNHHPDSYLCTAFFVLSIEGNKKQFNFLLSDGKVMCFDVGENGEKITQSISSMATKEKSPEIKLEEVEISPEKAAEIAEKEFGRKSGKVILVLQKLGKETIWNVTCMDGFILHRFHISAKTGKAEKMDDVKLNEMLRIEKKTPDYIQ